MDELVNKLKNRIQYDHISGKLLWKYREDMPASFNNRWVNRPALNTVNGNGHLHGYVDGQAILAHRAAWAIYHGEYRTDIFHYDRNKLNNQIINLRAYGLPPFGYPDYFVSQLNTPSFAHYLVRCI